MSWYRRDVRNQNFRVRYWVVTYILSFFFNLVEKNLLIVNKISKCRKNGIDRLRNEQLNPSLTFNPLLQSRETEKRYGF